MILISAAPTSQSSSSPTIEVEWDDVAGTVTGPGADYLLELAAYGSVPQHPEPGTYKLSASPLTSHVDMAAMVGWLHFLPASLAAYYPVNPDPEFPPGSDIDAADIIF